MGPIPVLDDGLVEPVRTTTSPPPQREPNLTDHQGRIGNRSPQRATRVYQLPPRIPEIQYPDATFLNKGWFTLVLTTIDMLFTLIPNIWNPRLLQYYFRFVIAIFFTLFLFY